MLETVINSEFFPILRIVLDIAVLSFIYYFTYRLLRKSNLPFLFNQIGAIIFIYVMASLLQLHTVLWIFRSIVMWVVIVILVVFQPEIRALVMRFDYTTIFRRTKNSGLLPDMTKIAKTISMLIKVGRGAILVFPRRINLEHIINSKVDINAELSVELLQTIFEYDTALHDGAVIIHENKITHAGCFLPIERGETVKQNLGARHRAALGLSQNSDAVILVVSEEYRSVSLVFDGEFLYDIGLEKACLYTEQLLTDKKIELDLDELHYDVEGLVDEG